MIDHDLPNKSPEPTRVGAFRDFARGFWFFIVIGRGWLSFHR